MIRLLLILVMVWLVFLIIESVFWLILLLFVWNIWLKKLWIFCCYFLWNFLRCLIVLWVFMKMKWVDYWYLVGSLDSVDSMLGVFFSGKLLIDMVCMNLWLMWGIMFVYIFCLLMMEFRYIGLEGRMMGWLMFVV